MDISSDNDTPADDPETPARGSSVESTRGGTGTRVVIEEFEQYRTEGNVFDRRIVTIPGRGPVLTTELRDGRRLVHLDVVALDGLL